MNVLPITVPSRAELWFRVQLAKSLLSHRPATSGAAAVVLRVLDGVSLETLTAEEGIRGAQ